MAAYGDGRKCAVCGAPISDNNPDGIGCECRAVYKDARAKVFFQDADRRNAFYSVDTPDIMTFFIDLFGKTKFRSEFKKSFYASITKQYEEKGFVTKKQKDIMLDWLFYKAEWLDVSDTLRAKWGNVKAQMIKDFTPSAGDIIHIQKLANKLRHSYRARS